VRSARLRLVTLAAVVALTAAACHGGSGPSKTGSATTSTTVPDSSSATTSTTTAGRGPAIVLSTQGDELDAYTTTRPFVTQVVVPSQDADHDGVNLSGQICFDPTDPQRFVAVDGTAAADGQIGWGVFELSGSSLGKLKASETARLVPSFQHSADPPTPFGCAFLPDGRLLTTDLGNQTSGAADGQLVEWFPPLDRETVPSCKVAVTLAAPEGVLADGEHVYVAESRGGGITSFLTSTLPIAARANAGCSQRDPVHALLAFGVVRSALLPNAAALGLANPAVVAHARNGDLYVSSPRTGVIAQITPAGHLVQRVLAPRTGTLGALGARPFATGTPMGLAVAPDGAIYYADNGLERRGATIAPGVRAGTIRRIAFAGGKPLLPEVVGSGLQAPEGVGIWLPPS
jgi:hypothetical protein